MILEILLTVFKLSVRWVGWLGVQSTSLDLRPL